MGTVQPTEVAQLVRMDIVSSRNAPRKELEDPSLLEVFDRSYRKARRSKPFPMQTSDSGSTKQGYNFHLELMWSRFGAFWEFAILGIVRTLEQDCSYGETIWICAFSSYLHSLLSDDLFTCLELFHPTFIINKSDNSVECLLFARH